MATATMTTSELAEPPEANESLLVLDVRTPAKDRCQLIAALASR
ncbi:MAG: hypothetical protein WA880_07770 [Ornithinimicrobium sp.]